MINTPTRNLDRLPLDPGVRSYLEELVQLLAPTSVISVILFGSCTSGGYSKAVSDVDLLLVHRDGITPGERKSIEETVGRLETAHGLSRKPERQSRMEVIAATITANRRAFFVCSRADLLSGDPSRILGISTVQAQFVDRVAVPSIVGSGRTLYGDDLLPQVPLLPIRRFDVIKAFHALINQVILTIVMYPFTPRATKYAMDALKRSIHNCYFTFELRCAKLDEEIAFFERRYGRNRTFERLLALRGDYRPSFPFIAASLFSIARLHCRTARDNDFPKRPAWTLTHG